MDRRIVIAVFPGIQALDLVGPLEVFHAAHRHVAEGSGYCLEVVAETAEVLRSSSGLQFLPDRSFSSVRGAIDTLVIAGGEGARAAAHEPHVQAWVRRVSPRCRRVTAVCTGAFVLAAAGVLSGRRATTHWAHCKRLARDFPDVDVTEDSLYVRDGAVWTSAGVTAGMDLALALVQEDLGSEVALAVARQLVMFVHRPGGQSQFSAQLASQLAEREPLRDLQAFIADNPSADLSVARLAARVAMSPRNFARAFVAEVGVTPAAFVERARIEVARRLLETTREDVEAVATRAGFDRVETLRRAFQRGLGVSPRDYRRRFQPRSQPEET